MKKLCLGTFLKILSHYKKENTKQYVLIKALLSVVKEEERYSEEKFQGALLSGKNNLTNYEEILTINKETLLNKILDKIDPFFNEDGKRLIILSIRNVLKDDKTLDDYCNIGYESEGYTKQDIITKQVFPFADFIANVFYYCTTSVKNIPYKENIKEINKDFFDGLKTINNDIKLETKTSYITSKITMTLNPKSFKNIFIEEKSSSLSIPNNNELKIFLLDVINSQIDYKKLQDFITNNIGRYIYSRAIRNHYDINEQSNILAIKALKAYKSRVSKDISTNHFNEIMLYSFLECILGAPKIFSKMELQDKSGMYESKSSGIHILTLKQGGIPFNQLVFGATDTVETLEAAVDNAFNQILSIKDSKNEEFEFLETTILNNEFDLETNKALENMIIPKESSKESRPDSAFGVFLGYNVSVKNEPNNDLYKDKLKIQMEKDINNISSYLNKKIKSLGLSNYSFYVYILPFNNIRVDKEQIMKNALEV